MAAEKRSHIIVNCGSRTLKLQSSYYELELDSNYSEPCSVLNIDRGPWRFHVQFERQRALVDTLNMKLNLFRQNVQSESTFKKNPKVGDPVIFRSNKRFYRGLVLETTNDNVEIYCVDNGYSLKKDISEIWKCPADVLDIPLLVATCCLYGLPDTLDEGTSKAFRRLFSGHNCGLVGIVLNKNSNEGSTLVSLYINGKSVLDLITNYDQPSTPEKFEAQICHIDEITDIIYIQDFKLRFKLRAMQEELQTLLAENEVIIKKDQPCLALRSSDKQWYRGLIKDTGDPLTVLFVDFGNEEAVAINNVRMIDLKHIRRLPALAIPCILNNIGNKPLTFDVNKVFKEHDTVNVVVVGEKTVEHKEERLKVYVVELYSTLTLESLKLFCQAEPSVKPRTSFIQREQITSSNERVTHCILTSVKSLSHFYLVPIENEKLMQGRSLPGLLPNVPLRCTFGDSHKMNDVDAFNHLKQMIGQCVKASIISSTNDIYKVDFCLQLACPCHEVNTSSEVQDDDEEIPCKERKAGGHHSVSVDKRTRELEERCSSSSEVCTTLQTEVDQCGKSLEERYSDHDKMLKGSQSQEKEQETKAVFGQITQLIAQLQADKVKQEGKIQHNAAQMENMEVYLAAYKEQLELSTQEKHLRKAELNEKSSSLSDLNEKIQHLCQEKEQFLAEKTKLEEELGSIIKQIKSQNIQQEELNNLQTMYEEKHESNKLLNTTLEKMKVELNWPRSKAHLRELCKVIEDYRMKSETEGANLYKQLHKLQEELGTVKLEKKEKDKDIKITLQQQQIDRLEKKNKEQKNLEIEISQLKSEVSDLQGEISKRDQNALSLQKELDTVKLEKDEISTRFNHVTRDHKRANEEHKLLQNSLAMEKESVLRLESEKEDLTTRQDQQIVEQNKMSVIIEEKNKELAIKDAKMTLLQQQIDRLEKDKTELIHLESEKSLASYNEDLSKKEQTLHDENLKLCQENEKSSQKLQEIESARVLALNKLASFKLEMDQMISEIVQTQEERASYHAKVQQLLQVLTQHSGSILSSGSEVASLPLSSSPHTTFPTDEEEMPDPQTMNVEGVKGQFCVTPEEAAAAGFTREEYANIVKAFKPELDEEFDDFTDEVNDLLSRFIDHFG